MGTVAAALGFFLGGIVFALADVSAFRHRDQIGRDLADWWVEESRSRSGRRRWSSGVWGSARMQRREDRAQAGQIQSVILIVLLTTISLICALASIALLTWA
jgi:hypothetical protein